MKQVKGLITPLAIGSFLLMSITGILMFFHLDTGLNNVAHEWLSWLFLGVVFLHILYVHKKSFLSYFKRGAPQLIIGAGILVTGLSFISLEGSKGGSPMQQIAHTLYQADLTVVGDLLQISRSDLQETLKRQGLEVKASDVNLEMIADRNELSDKQILKRVFGK